ncbi:RBR-type E3 ubiquitin transferase [Mycena venus]|uniref:RBR-type E3 ubiquitin transferase n=1 Tax=Mycena venus TaxID=2733690 RepID=A0A8H6XYJ5_9AGAR|nr:RBR-type E3 ubiquitin transferase [Mycena venus]
MIDCMEIDDSEDEDKLHKPVKQGIRLANCGHYFCGACLAQAIYRCLNIKFDPATYGTVLGPSVAATPGLNAKWPVYCPTCIKPEMQRVPLSDVTALQVLGEPNIDEWNHTRLLSTLKLILCPHKGCEETFLPNEDSNPLMQCPRCGGSLCKVCKCVWHENMTCEGSTGGVVQTAQSWSSQSLDATTSLASAITISVTPVGLHSSIRTEDTGVQEERIAWYGKSKTSKTIECWLGITVHINVPTQALSVFPPFWTQELPYLSIKYISAELCSFS